MRPGIHPQYDFVVFYDSHADRYFRIRSTLAHSKEIKEHIDWQDGQRYPLVRIDVSSASHPVYTGEQRRALNDEGRSARFARRYGKRLAGE
ncbi:type B 50S ribosomal protein L31 [Balneatrix alpica]|uniref:50S ribosomal protein L31 n=1 Tax=Balneatrix alpica TaxID=75684 RepID=A0ABV5ZFE7_9GAMM|nr:type B 50S ribosomal protein L31 [Balneatrix alpica]